MKRHVLRTTHSSGKQKSTCKICNYCSELAYKKAWRTCRQITVGFFSMSVYFVWDCILHFVALMHCFLSEEINLRFYLFLNAAVCFKMYFRFSRCHFNLAMVKFFLYFQSSITTTKGQPGGSPVSSHPHTVLQRRKTYLFIFKVCFLWLEEHCLLPLSECTF